MPINKQISDLIQLLSPYFYRAGSSISGLTHALWGAQHTDVASVEVPADGDIIVYRNADALFHLEVPAGGGHDIEVNTGDLADRANLNFADGEGIDAVGTDDAGNDRTTITRKLDFAGLGVLPAADITADYFAVYDTSVTTHKKMLVGNLPWPTSGGATALGISWDGFTTADGILKNAVSVAEPAYMTGRFYVQQPLLVTKFTVDVNTAGTYDMWVTSGPYDGDVTPLSDILYTVEAGVVAGAPGNLDFTPTAWMIFSTGTYYITVHRDGGAAQNICETDAASEQGRGCALYWSDALWFDGTLQTADWPVMNLEATVYLGWWKPAGGAVYSDVDVSDLPLDAEIDAIWGSPAAVGEGFLGIIDDNGAGTTVWLVTSDGTNWHVVEFAVGAGGDVATDAIWDAKGDLAVGTGPDTASKLVVGADDLVLTADAATATGLKWAAAGAGGGDSTHTATYATRPATSNDGDLFLPSDGMVVERDTGAAWIPWGPLFACKTPPTAGWSWVNQGAATEQIAYGGVYLEAPGSAGQNMRIRTRAAPGTPYTITVTMLPLIWCANYSFSHLGWRQSADGKLAHLRYGWNNGFGISSVKSASPTNDAANYVSTTVPLAYPRFFRIGDDGTNRTIWYSHDGIHWLLYHSVARADYLTPDEVFWAVDSRVATQITGCTLLSWVEA